MDKLTFELRSLCKQNKDGSYATQADRMTQLKLIAIQLKRLGYRNLGVRSLRTTHVNALVKSWMHGTGSPDHKVSTGTIKNRMAVLRWWARKINKQNIIPRTNNALSIPDRKRLPDHNKAFTLSTRQLSALPRHLNLAARLQQEFGLRREEAAKFIPSKAIEEDNIQILATWAKGGRARSIPITTPAQRALLAELDEAKPNASMIPPEYSYRGYLSHRNHFFDKLGIKNAHGLRHRYAQQRYQALTGGLLPPRMGGKKPSKLTAKEQALDQKARLVISLELGHNRLEITRIYLG
ncbi:MAG: integrase [Gammaproteobacteria bacterium]|nr:integrase [Gammaproteobacteria bacterium]